MSNSTVYVIDGYITYVDGDGNTSFHHALIGVTSTPWDAIHTVKPFFGCAVDKALEELVDTGTTYGKWLNPPIGDKKIVSSTIVITEEAVIMANT